MKHPKDNTPSLNELNGLGFAPKCIKKSYIKYVQRDILFKNAMVKSVENTTTYGVTGQSHGPLVKYDKHNDKY